MSNTSSKNKDIFYYIHVVIMLFFMFGFPRLAPIEPLTAQGMHAVGIFMGLLWAWTFVDLLWPSILGMVAVGLSGFMTIDAAFNSGFGNTTVIMVAACLVFAGYLTATGVCKTVAYWFVSRKACIGHPFMFAFYLLLACYILGATAGPMAAIVIGWAVVYEVANITGYKQGESFPATLLVGVVVASMLGSTVFPWRAMAVIGLNNARNILAMECSFVDWVIPSFCTSFLAMTLYIVLVKFIVRPDVSRLAGDTDHFSSFREQLQLTTEQKIAMATLVAVIVIAATPSFLPAGSGAKVFLSKFSSIGPLMLLAMAVLYAVRINGKPIIDYPAIMKNGMDWTTIVMLASSMPVASMVQHADSGVTVLINNFLTNLLGNYGAFAIACLFVLFTIIVTQIAHNLVMMIVLAPILCNLSVAMGFNPMPALMMLAFAANAGIATAGASVMGAMIFANRDWIPVKNAFAYTWIAVAICAVAMCVVGIPLAMALGAGTPIV